MIAFKTLFTTFYSYKGGVGRTSALVNAAILRAISGDRVIVLDFDLEAPGLSSYVKELASKNNKKIDLDSRPGILDYVYDATENQQVPMIKENAISGKDLGLEIDGEIWFVGAGNTTDSEYSKKLGSLNWAEIFEKKQGALLLENLKRQIISEFDGPDYVFVDSRTGITEIGGVCTRYLADLVVVLSSLNEQNILGTSRIYHAFKESKIATILVASNVPVGLPWGEEQLFTGRINNFTKKFDSPPDLLIYHYPSLSLMEYLPAYFKLKGESAVLNEDPLLKSYETLSNEIDLKNPSSFDKFLNEIFTKLIFPTPKREAELEEAFLFFSKYYSNRKNILEFIKTLHDLKKLIDSPSKEKITDNFLEKLKKLRSSKVSSEYRNLYMLRRMVVDNASELIVSYYSKNKSMIRKPYEWYSQLEGNLKLDAIVLLLDMGEYDFVYKSISDEELEGYFILAKAYASDKLNYKDSFQLYERFLKNVQESRVTNPGVLFASAYAAYRINKIDVSRAFLLKAYDVVKDDAGPTFFVPTKFKRIKSKNEFLKELTDFEKNLPPVE